MVRRAVVSLLILSAASSAEIPLPAVGTSIAEWLASERLDSKLSLEKLRWGSRADDLAGRQLQLELRFITESTDEDKERNRLAATLGDYNARTGESLGERLFYKLIHLAGVPRADAAVHIFVLDRCFESSYDRPGGGVKFRETTDRGVRERFAFDTLAIRNSVALAPGAELPTRIQNFLADYFTKTNHDGGLPAPVIDRKPLEPDYAGLDITGVRKQVVRNQDFWESLQISIELKPTGAVCYLDGRYAAGIGAKLPDPGSYKDMELKYRTEMVTFTQGLLRKLQEALGAR